MGMHITLREQFASNHPNGIESFYKKILIKTGDPHKAEHLMMDCLAESLWQAQRTNQLPDDQAYIQCLKQIISRFWYNSVIFDPYNETLETTSSPNALRRDNGCLWLWNQYYMPLAL